MGSGTQDEFARAVALHGAGQIAAAAQAYAALLEIQPGHAEALIHFGVLRASEGRGAEAEALLRGAVAVAPASAEAAANLGAVLQSLGRYADAIAEYQRALTLRSDLADARFGLAACLQAGGRYAQAMNCYDTILAADPDHAEAWYGSAGLLALEGRADEAIRRYRAALAADPDFAEASLALGDLLARRGEHAEAQVCFRQALAVDSEYGEAHLALARLLDADRRHEAAIPHYRAVLAAEPGHVDAMAGLAGALKGLGQHAEALALAREVLASRPGSAPAFGLLGSVLAELGALDEARTQLRQAVALAPERPEFSYHLLQLGKAKPGDSAITTLERLLTKVDELPPQDRCLVHFGLAKAYDDIGERDLGFDHLLLGNAAKRSVTPYDEAASLAAMAYLEQLFTPALLAARLEDGDPSRVPVFIVGMPRSGTTLVEQIVASHPAVFGAGERPELSRVLAASGATPDQLVALPAPELRRMGESYLTTLRLLAPSAARITDKMPINFLHVGLIRLILPGARIIHCRRDPVDTCLSCFSKLFAGEQRFAYDLGELGRFHHAYRRLMAHWRAALPDGVMLEVDYESLVDDLETQARRLVAHCGLPWDPACLDFHATERPVHTASFAQVRQPIYRSAVGRWRPRADLLRPLLDGLDGR